MAKTILVRIRKEDFDKIIKEKKIPMEKDLKEIFGKPIKIKNPQLFRIAANSIWDLGNETFFKSLKIKKGKLKL